MCEGEAVRREQDRVYQKPTEAQEGLVSQEKLEVMRLGPRHVPHWVRSLVGCVIELGISHADRGRLHMSDKNVLQNIMWLMKSVYARLTCYCDPCSEVIIARTYAF
jgi:hypothetical protein